MNGEWKATFSRPSLIIIFTMVVLFTAVFMYTYINLENNDKQITAEIAKTDATAKTAFILQRKLAKENFVRRNQNCILFEEVYINGLKNYYDADRSLDQTLEYLANLTSEERGSSLNKTIQTNLPQTKDRVSDAKNAIITVPQYCSQQGIGLPADRIKDAEAKYRVNNG